MGNKSSGFEHVENNFEKMGINTAIQKMFEKVFLFFFSSHKPRYCCCYYLLNVFSPSMIRTSLVCCKNNLFANTYNFSDTKSEISKLMNECFDYGYKIVSKQSNCSLPTSSNTATDIACCTVLEGLFKNDKQKFEEGFMLLFDSDGNGMIEKQHFLVGVGCVCGMMRHVKSNQ